MRQTKQEMVKDIFFAATVGIRSAENFPEGMWVIEMIARNNYKEYIKALWDELDRETAEKAKATAHRLLDQLVDWTYINTSGVNGYTKTSLAFIEAAKQFI